MIELLKDQLKRDMSPEDKLNRVREFLQVLILKILYDKGWFNHLTFVGGTALRVLYGLRRFSEDLDFSLIEKKQWDFKLMRDQVCRELQLNGLKIEAKDKDETTIQSILFKFHDLSKELGISPHQSQKILIKLEMDTNPPAGGNLERTLINQTYIFQVTHYDLASLFATKIHACFYRRFVKGRDFYDFIWYLGRQIKPNYVLLNNAIVQTQGEDLHLDAATIKNFLLEKIQNIDLHQAAKDVERFLEDKSELKLFDLELIQNSIGKVFV